MGIIVYEYGCSFTRCFAAAICRNHLQLGDDFDQWFACMLIIWPAGLVQRKAIFTP
jgi:hypothetical protein